MVPLQVSTPPSKKRAAASLTPEKLVKPEPSKSGANLPSQAEDVTKSKVRRIHTDSASDLANFSEPKAERMVEEPFSKTSYPLVARERECGVVDEFLEASLKPGKVGQGCLYLSGGPGTGKTSVARAAAKSWKHHNAFSSTQVLEINCMDNLRPCSVPGFLLRVIQACSAVSGYKSPALNSMSPTSNLVAAAVSSLRSLGRSVILIVDEVDQLVKKSNAGDQSLEIICGLPKQPEAPALAIIMIANHVDLMVKACGQRWKTVCSSLLFERYSWQQLKRIVQRRFVAAGKDGELAEEALGGKKGLELHVRRLANEGDCRHIVRLCDEGLAKASELKLAEEAADSVPSTASKPSAKRGSVDVLDSVKSLPLLQKALICALCTKDDPMSTSEVFQKMLACMLELKQPPSTKPQVSSALSRLEQCGIISLKKMRGKGKGRGKGAKKEAPGAVEELITTAVCRARLKEVLEESATVLLQLRCFAPDSGQGTCS